MLAQVLTAQAGQRTLATEQWVGVLLGTVLILGVVTVLILRPRPTSSVPSASRTADHEVTPALLALNLDVTLISAEALALREVTLRDLSDHFLTTFTRLALDTVAEIDDLYQASRVTHPRLQYCARFVRAITLYRVELLHETPYDHQEARNALLDLPAAEFSAATERFFNALQTHARADFFVLLQTATGNLTHITQLQAQHDDALHAGLLPPERIDALFASSAEKAL